LDLPKRVAARTKPVFLRFHQFLKTEKFASRSDLNRISERIPRCLQRGGFNPILRKAVFFFALPLFANAALSP